MLVKDNYHIYTTNDLMFYLYKRNYDKFDKRLKQKGHLLKIYYTPQEIEILNFHPDKIAKFKKEPWDA